MAEAENRIELLNLDDPLLLHIISFCEMERFGYMIARTCKHLRDLCCKDGKNPPLPLPGFVAGYPQLLEYLECESERLSPHFKLCEKEKEWLLSRDALQEIINLQTASYRVHGAINAGDAILYGAAKCFAYMLRKGFEPSVTKISYKHFSGCSSVTVLEAVALRMNKLSCFEILVNRFGLAKNLAPYAAEAGPDVLDMIMRRYQEKGITVPIDEELCAGALKSTNLAEVQYLREQNPNLDYLKLLPKACASKSIDCIKFIEGCVVDSGAVVYRALRVRCLKRAVGRWSRQCIRYIMTSAETKPELPITPEEADKIFAKVFCDPRLVLTGEPVFWREPPNMKSREQGGLLADVAACKRAIFLYNLGIRPSGASIVSACSKHNFVAALFLVNAIGISQRTFELAIYEYARLASFYHAEDVLEKASAPVVNFIAKALALGCNIEHSSCWDLVKIPSLSPIVYRHGCLCATITLRNALDRNRPDLFGLALTRGRKLDLAMIKLVLETNNPGYLQAIKDSGIPLRKDIAWLAVKAGATDCLAYALAHGFKISAEGYRWAVEENSPCLPQLSPEFVDG